MKLQADQKKHELKLRTDQLTHEVDTLRVALKAELASNKESYEFSIQQFKEADEFSTSLIRMDVLDGVYKSLLEKIGLLSEEEVKKVIRAYRVIGELPYRLRIIESYHGDGRTDEERIAISSHMTGVALAMYEAFLGEIVEAIQELEKYKN
ncbi:MAG: hypothetical protein JAZ17_02435 [Candidatus Thiodiazotropha endolucinida]|nr:hypothetical protein [Candidatus Thiodiazotropha endolucinida]